VGAPARPWSLVHLAGFDLEVEEGAFDSWYEGEHLPAVLSRPGWRGARRFMCLNGEPRFLTLFDLGEDALVPGRRVSEGLLAAAVVERRGIRDYHARTYRLIHEAGEHRGRPDLVNVITVDIDDQHAESFSRWYNEVHFPEILACPGWRAGRRYECVDGEPRFLAVYDLDDEKTPFSSPEFAAAVGWDEHVAGIRGYHGFRIYRLIYDSHG
jgi:hypothetical protein